jgi:AcrR family transcriptional regulator
MFVTNRFVKNMFSKHGKMLCFSDMRSKPISRRERPAKAPLSRDAIVRTALAILSEDGLEKVTMRRIADALDTGAASLYVYVRDTQDLHLQILDALVAEVPAPKPGPKWRAHLTEVTEAFLALLMRHPEIARMAIANHAMGPNAMRLADTVAGLLLRGGATTRGAAWGVDLVLAFVVATAVEHAGRSESEHEELVDLRQTLLLDAATHPSLSKLGDELISGEGRGRFRWGLEVIVSGILNQN